MKIFLSGSLRNKDIPDMGSGLRNLGFEVFDDWFGVGPEADDYWQKYEMERGRTYEEALYGVAAQNTYRFDLKHLLASDIVILCLPAGKSGHMELGYGLGKGKIGYIYFSEGEPERWDVMYQFADNVFFHPTDLEQQLKGDLEKWQQHHGPSTPALTS